MALALDAFFLSQHCLSPAGCYTLYARKATTTSQSSWSAVTRVRMHQLSPRACAHTPLCTGWQKEATALRRTARIQLLTAHHPLWRVRPLPEHRHVQEGIGMEKSWILPQLFLVTNSVQQARQEFCLLVSICLKWLGWIGCGGMPFFSVKLVIFFHKKDFFLFEALPGNWERAV